MVNLPHYIWQVGEVNNMALTGEFMNTYRNKLCIYMRSLVTRMINPGSAPTVL